MKICKQCKAECSNEAKFCQECGYRFTENDKPVKVCKNCNTHNPESSKFCQECGSQLDVIVVNVTNENLKKDAEDKPNSALEQFVENKSVVSLPDEEKGSQADTESTVTPITDEDKEDKTETLIEPDPDLRGIETSDVSQSEEKAGESPVQTEDIVPETVVESEPIVPETPVQEEKPDVETVTEEPVKEQPTSNVTKLLDFDFSNAKSDKIDTPKVKSDVPVENESKNSSQTDSNSTSTEGEANNGPSVSEIIANDPYYDDVPLNDKEEIEKPSLDKDTIKKVVALVAGALVFIVAITVVLVITS